MKKALIYLAALPLALLALSCTKDVDAPEVADVYEIVPFVASLNQSSTKTAINDDTGKVSWVENDLIRYYSKKEGEINTLNIGTILNEGTAMIEPSIPISANFMIAAYGGSGLSNNDGQGFTLSGVVTGVQDGTFVGSHAAVAKIQKSNNGWPDKLIFKNIIPFVSFTLGAKADEVDYAVFEAGNGAKLHSDGKLYVSFDGIDVSSITLPAGGGGNSIKVPISGAGTYYIALAPGSYAGFNLSFYKSTGGGADKYIGSAVSGDPLNLAMNSLVRLGIIDGRINKIYTNLSKDATANCYVVSKVGDYMIRADVKGDGSESIDLSGNIYPVLFWESVMTGEKPAVGDVISDLKYENGFLSFSSGVDGNAVIGIQNTDEATLWSWHIWVCSDYDPANTATGAVNSKVLDRNIGALAPGGDGLVYQWGRKDPFLPEGIDATKSHDPLVFSDLNGKVEKAIDYPNAIIQPGANGDWIYGDSINDLWGGTKPYDPCPAGWRVPDTSFETQAAQWLPAGNYWTCNVSDVYAVAFNAAEPLGRASLAMVRCVAQNKIEVTGVSLNKSSITVNPGESVTLSASISPANASVQKVNWTVNPEGFVNIQNVSDNEIQVTGVEVGKCVITASADGKSASCTVDCGVPVASVSLNQSAIVVAPGATKQLTATVKPDNATIKTVTWTSDKTSIATVDENGLVTGVAEGTCVITATAHNGKTAICNVEVASHKVTNLNIGGKTANCYIVNASGDYCFYAKYRGNSKESIGDPVSAEELWGTFNNSTAPRYNEMIKNVKLEDNVVYFTVPDPMVDGNVVIAVRDANNDILWSWHIWLSKDFSPEATEQQYKNSGAIMMDRNLGALSATKGDIQSVGLLYQWGRKDPFPGSRTFSGRTATPYATYPEFPSPISAGSIETSIRYPMKFMKASTQHQDWYAYSASVNDSTAVKADPYIENRWSRDKTEFDPCPIGWRVPDGGASGVWSTAFGRSDSFVAANNWLGGQYGYDFQGMLANADVGTVWYPISAYITAGQGNIMGQGQYAMYWACTTPWWNESYGRVDDTAHQLYFYTNTSVQPSNSYARAQGCAVRCLKDGSFYGVPLKRFSIGKEGQTEYECSIRVNQTLNLLDNVLIFSPANATNKAIKLVSMDTTYVKVDNSGTIKGDLPTIVPIEVTITAADGNRVVTCMVTVTQ